MSTPPGEHSHLPRPWESFWFRYLRLALVCIKISCCFCSLLTDAFLPSSCSPSVWSLLPDVSLLLSCFALWSLVVRPHRFIFAQHYFLSGWEEDWLWLPLGCLCATSGFCPQTPILKRLTESKVYLLNLPYPMPLIGLFNFVAGFAAEVAFF